MRHLSLLTLILIATLVPAQSPPQSLWTGGWGHSGPVGQRGAVRDSSGDLFALVIDRGGGTQDALTLLRSSDGGQTWSLWLAPLNDASSGLTGTHRANQAVIAVDDQDRLHVSWQRAWYPSDYEQYYRNVDLSTGTMSAILNVNTMLGVPLTARSNAQAIHVAADGRVWMTGPTASNWQETLLVSAQPYAAGSTFNVVGPVAPSGQGQNTRLAFDASGALHAIYYAGNQIRHRSHNPSTGAWSGVSVVAAHGGGSMARAFDLRADAIGGVHAIAMVNTTPTAGTINPALRYTRRDATSGWSPGINVGAWTQAQITDPSGALSNMRTAGLAVNEITGDVFVAVRDFGSAAGALVIARKATGDAAFHRMTTLTPPSAARDDYHAPFFVGHENPGTTLTVSDLQVFWRQGPAGSQFSAWHAQQPGAPLAAAITLGSGCSGTSGAPLNLTAPPPIIGETTWAALVSGGPAGGSASIYSTPTPGPNPVPVGGGCSVYLDLGFLVIGAPLLGPLPLDALGQLPIAYPIPADPALAGLRLTAQVAVADPGANAINLVLSNGLDLFFGW